LNGLRGGASVYRRLVRLREAGLIDEIHPALRVGRNPGLLYLTDLGIATVAVDRQLEPVHLARRTRLCGPDLLALLPGLPHLLATYQLLVALAGVGSGQADLLAWENPWRRRIRRPTRKAAMTVELPAYVVLAWDDQAADFVLVPDLATFPLRVYRPPLEQVLASRRMSGGSTPALVVATTQARLCTWMRLLDDLARFRGDAPLLAHVTTWRDLRDDTASLGGLPITVRPSSTFPIRGPRIRRLAPRQPERPIPRPVGSPFEANSSNRSLGSLVLAVAPIERPLLNLVGRHPFLPADSLATVLGWEVRRVRERRARLIRLGLVRLLGVGERHSSSPEDLTELTGAGLEIVAAQQGLSLARAVDFNGLAGGGPYHPTGSRRLLLRDLHHTLGADDLFIGVYRHFRATVATKGGDALLEWRNAAACSRRRVRPDGYAMIRLAGRLHGFFLEYDRGTMSARDYSEKWARYYDYRDSFAFERDYDGFPTILVVTTNSTAEERIARSARAASVGRWHLLPLLLTCEWRITSDPTNRDGLLGSVWRTPEASGRQRWPGCA
jgi:hypothetical protein